MQKKLIAVAVAGVVVAPLAHADEHETLSMYGRINSTLDFTEAANGDETQDMESGTSRFGIRGNVDLGNGMSAIGHYEFSTTSDNDNESSTFSDIDNDGVNDNTGGSGIGRRLSYVGVSGAFGTLTLGQQWSAYFSASGNLSQNYHNGPAPIGPARTGNTIQYTNSLGPVSFELDARVDDAGDGDGGNGYGASATLTPMAGAFVALGIDSREDDNVMHTVAAGGATFGPVNFVVGAEQMEDDTKGMEEEQTNLVVGGGLAVNDNLSLLLSYGVIEDDKSDAEYSEVTFGATYVFAPGFKVYGEFTSPDTDDSTMALTQQAEDTMRVGVQIDF